MKRERSRRISTLLLLGLPLFHLNAADVIPLGGTWRFQLDPEDCGMERAWFLRSLTNEIRLPGALQHQGFGENISTNTPWTGGILDRSWFTAPEYAKYRQPGNIKVPFWLQPEKYYAGAAWFQRDIDIPIQWQRSRLILFLERAHWETRVWLDDRLMGTNTALGTPHEFDFGWARPGRHQLTIRIDNRLVIDVGRDSHSVSDHTQGNWNGLVGRLELRVVPRVWISDLQVFAQPTAHQVHLCLRLHNPEAEPVTATLTARLEPVGRTEPLLAEAIQQDFRTSLTNALVEFDMPLIGPPKLWDEFSPALYQVRAELRADVNGKILQHRQTATFGWREISTQGTQFVINGRKTFIRGTLESCIFPRTGYPPTDVDSWKRIIRTAKSYGLNNFRFHSWCPPEAAFAAADELGFYFDIECSSWANASTTLGDGKPVDRWIYEEADRILRYYGCHPSFLLMAYGNEPGGANHSKFLAQWVEHYKSLDRRRLYTSAAGWPQLPENQFHVTPDPRIQSWGGGLKTRINARPPETSTDYAEYIQKRNVPVISHEIGQWCVYPNFDEIPKYRGPLKPRNFEIFRDRLNERGMIDLARPFLIASGKLQTLCYKEEIESALRTRGMGGFQLLDLHDFPGQGTALVGVLDPFWEPKGYVTASEYRRFCNSTVLLARLKKRVFLSDEPFEAAVEIAHFGPAPIQDPRIDWKITSATGKTLLTGQLPSATIPIDNGIPLGDVRVELESVPTPALCHFVVTVRSRNSNPTLGSFLPDGDAAENDWDFWVYPPRNLVPPPGDVLIAHNFDAQTLSALENGSKVLLLLATNQVKGDALGTVALGFSSIFWNTAWTHRQPPHTLGILCNPKHPLFSEFPTEGHSNWQWWYLIHHAGAMILDDLPTDLRPTVQVIDDWFTARRLGLLFEAKLGPGKLIVCSLDLSDHPASDPVTRQFRKSLFRYMSGDRFRPKTSVTADQIRSLLESDPSHHVAFADH